MADYSPTIIAASLNDKELQSAIDKLVKYVDDGALKMAESFNAGVQLMRESLQSLGKGNIANNIFSHARAHNEVTKALEKEAVGYDNLERARSRAVGRREIKHDYVQLDSDVDKQFSYIIDMNKDVDAQLQHMIEHEQKLIQEKEREAQVTREIQQVQQAQIARGGVSGASLGWGDVGQMEVNSRKWYAQQESVKATTQSYSELEKVISTYLGISEQELNLQIKKNGSYVTLSESLKKMTSAYAEMTKEERNSGAGRNLAENIQRVQRAEQQAQAQMSRPVSLKSALGIDVKTLDDIAYKIQMLQRYRSGIDITKPNASIEIDSVNKAIAELTKKQRELLGTNKSLLESNNALARSWNYMKNRLAFYFTVGASTAFVKNLIEVRSQYELLERSMGILFDSMQTGTKIFAELNAMALKSPFTTIELGSAAKQLSAYNIAAKDVVDTTRRLADMAAAVGIPIERLTYALGQIKSYGYLNSRDQRMFANAGIPLVQSLADMYSKLEGRLVSMGDVYDRIKKKQVSFEDTMKVINEMTDEGGRFFDFQAKSADTLKVRLANLTLAWNNMLNELGKDSQGVISGTLGGAKVLFDNWRKINNVIVSVITEVGILKGLQLLILALNKKLLVQKEVELVLGKKITKTIWNTASAMKALAVNPMTWLTLVATTLTYMAWQWYDIKKAAEEFNKTIAKNAQENIDSINKFYSQYAKDIETVTSLQQADQQKLWERVREEIEKTSKNAKQYIETLELIPNIAERVIGGKETLDQIKVIEQEVKRISEQDIFNVGGGFADDSLAEDLEEYDKAVKSIAKNYKSLQDALNWHRNIQTGKELSGLAGLQKYWKLDAQVSDIREANSELDKFVAKLSSADLQRVMGSGDAKTQIANLREFAHIIRDNFLATEQGQKVGIEGQAKLNASLDRWIVLQAKAKNLLDDEQISIELHRSAWEEFFDTLNEEERKRVDYLVRTNQLGSEEFKKIWDNAAEHLKKSSETSYQQIQEQIADLRGTAPIVIDVIYRERREQKDAQQEKFEADLITPKYVKGNGKVVTADDYFAELTKLRAKYGRFNKKEGEDNVDWEKRLGEEYQSNAQKIKTLNNQLENSATLSEIDRKAKENDRDLLVGINDVLEQIENREGFDYSQFAKGGKSGGSKKDILGDALAKELQLITDIQKLYKEYTKAGVDSEAAKNAAAKEYQKTLEQTNNTLSKFGVQGLTGEQLATMDLRSMRDYYQSILEKVQSSPKAVEALEKAIRNLNVEITKEGQKTIIDSLNSELSRLKDEYELAVELDANPELGGVFADMMGLSKEELEKLPRDFEGVVRRLQTIVDNKLGMGAFDVRSNLNKDVFDQWIKANKYSQDSDLVAKLKALTDYANKIRQDETKKQIEDWNKLLEKYAEYEYKRKQITEEYEREISLAIKKNANQDILDAIENRRDREYAKLDFEEFQKSATWITATGDLATLTDSALGLLIDRLEEYKKSAKNLDTKQIKQINNALKSLRREQRQGNPFLAIANAKDTAKEAWDTYQQEIDEYRVKLKELNDLEEKNGELTLEQESTRTDLIGTIAKLRNEQEKAGKVSVKSLTEGISGMAGAISQASNLLADFFTQIGNSEAAENLKALSETLDKASQGAQIGSYFGKYGALIGGAVGLLMGLFSGWADEWSGNARITEKIKESKKQLRRLEESYKDVEFADEQAYGVETLGAKESLAAQKKLQLEELQRQLTLEESRKEKYKDEEKIESLKSSIHDLQLEISRSTKEIVQDLLGISSYGDAITQLVQVMIDAFRNGEDAMTAFGEKWDEMIDNMILKLVVSTFMQKEWDEIMKTLEQKKDEFLAQSTKDYQSANTELGIISKMTDDEIARRIAEQLGYSEVHSYNKRELEEMMQRGYIKATFTGVNPVSSLAHAFFSIEAWQQVTDEQIQAYRDALQQQINNAEKAGENAEEAYTRWAIDFLGQGEGRKRLEERARLLEEGLGEWYKFGQDSERQALSNLQQGIQGITEDTAGSIEGYLNGISQQIYLHSSQLEEIKTLMQGFDFDISLGTMSQILLQLQSSYQVQMSIQNILQGVLTPSGRAFMVEMQ